MKRERDKIKNFKNIFIKIKKNYYICLFLQNNLKIKSKGGSKNLMINKLINSFHYYRGVLL